MMAVNAMMAGNFTAVMFRTQQRESTAGGVIVEALATAMRIS